MAYYFLKSLAIFTFIQCGIHDIVNGSTFPNDLESNKTVKILINSFKDEDGEWVMTYHAYKFGSHVTNITLDLTQSVHQCNDNEAVYIKGIIRAKKSGDRDRLTFHPKCGKNAAISNDGRSVEKIKLDDQINGVVLTNRPLRRNELFEVRLDKKNNKFSWSMGIGVTSYTPESFSIPDHMFNLKSGNWMMYHAKIHEHGVDSIVNYGRDLNDLQVGDRVGVLVNKFGTLHFFINGVDQGPAASNMPLKLHGVFELFSNAVKVTIVDSSS